jgi:serine/threonine protein kinase
VTTREAMTDATPPVIAKALGPGTVIAGRYHLQARLGTGGGGTVWRCRDEQLGAIVALKIVGAGGDLERWRREVAMARRIANRNVCRVHDLGEAGELRYVTMELVEGDSLRARIAADLPAAAARDLFAQIVAGTAAIHAAGVVHRDLKPENIVVAHDGRAVIVDFGLAREPRGTAATTRTGPAVTDPGVVVGTPRYMSPEQAAGQAVDARTDVWALGLIGHELLTGALPQPDEHGRRVAPAVDAKWPGSSGVLRHCLALLPDERFVAARAVERALGSLGRRPRARNAIAIGALVAAAAGTGAMWCRGGHDTGGDDSPRRGDEVPPAGSAAPAVASQPTAPPRMTQLTATAPRKWPDETPISVALSPDASQLAYTTPYPRLLVRPVAGGSAVTWSMPALEKPRSRPSGTPESLFAMMWVVGWFRDGSLAVIGTDRDGGHQLHQVFADGRNQLLYRYAQRFTAAAAGDKVAIAIDDHAMFAISAAEGTAPAQIAALDPGERVLAMAWSPDGKRLAYARLPGDASAEASIRVVPASGGAGRDVWRGSLDTIAGAIAGQLLAWLDDDRLAFAGNDPASGRSRLFTVDARGGPAAQRDDWVDTYAGFGSAARGTLVMVRGSAVRAVQVSERYGLGIARLHDRGVRAQRLAGWTADRQVVFTVGAPGKEQIVRAAPGQGFESWPGTQPGVELPDTLVGDDLIAHRLDDSARQIVVERIAPDGAHTELARLSAHAAGCDVVRCAGDRAAPCIALDSDGRTVRWTEIDPRTGARGPQLHHRPQRDRRVCSAALSPGGKELAVVDGGEAATVIDRSTGKQEAKTAGDGAALQSVGFGPDGTMWATALGFRGRLSGVMLFFRLDRGSIADSPSSHRGTRSDALRLFSRASPSPDGKQVAFATLELELEVWRADGL